MIRNTFESLQGDFGYDKVQDIQNRLRLISGSMIMLNLTRIANALNACNQFISTIPDRRPDTAFLNHDGSRLFVGIIDAMSYYLEELSAEVGQQEYLLTELETKARQLVSLSLSLTSHSISGKRSATFDEGGRHDDFIPANT
jgi:hypothetical protein